MHIDHRCRVFLYSQNIRKDVASLLLNPFSSIIAKRIDMPDDLLCLQVMHLLLRLSCPLDSKQCLISFYDLRFSRSNFAVLVLHVNFKFVPYQAADAFAKQFHFAKPTKHKKGKEMKSEIKANQRNEK